MERPINTFSTRIESVQALLGQVPLQVDPVGLAARCSPGGHINQAPPGNCSIALSACIISSKVAGVVTSVVVWQYCKSCEAQLCDYFSQYAMKVRRSRMVSGWPCFSTCLKTTEAWNPYPRALRSRWIFSIATRTCKYPSRNGDDFLRLQNPRNPIETTSGASSE